MPTYSATTDVQYHDSRLMYWGIPLMTIFVVHVGLEEGLGELLVNTLYYENLIVSLAIAYLTFFSIRTCIIGFDEWLPWQSRNHKRWLLQLGACSVITSFWLLVNDCYDYIMLGERELFDQILLTVDLPVSILLVAGLNYYYYVQFGQACQYAGFGSSTSPKVQQHLLKTPSGFYRAQSSDIQATS